MTSLNTWKNELEIYSPHVLALSKSISEASNTLDKLPPVWPLDKQPDEKTYIAIQLAIFNRTALRVASELTTTAYSLFEEGKITSFFLQIRLLYEFWAALSYAAGLAEKLLTTNDIKSLKQQCLRLTMGSRIPVKLPWGGETTEQSINVLTFLKHLEVGNSEVSRQYAFLSEACHPSHIQLLYLWLAGSDGNNWTNVNFRNHAHTLIEELICCSEAAVQGVNDETKKIVYIVKPLLSAIAVPLQVLCAPSSAGS